MARLVRIPSRATSCTFKVKTPSASPPGAAATSSGRCTLPPRPPSPCLHRVLTKLSCRIPLPHARDGQALLHAYNHCPFRWRPEDVLFCISLAASTHVNLVASAESAGPQQPVANEKSAREQQRGKG